MIALSTVPTATEQQQHLRSFSTAHTTIYAKSDRNVFTNYYITTWWQTYCEKHELQVRIIDKV